MTDWIKSLLCKHKWQLVRQGPIRTYYGNTGMWLIEGHYKDFICAECLKKRRVKW